MWCEWLCFPEVENGLCNLDTIKDIKGRDVNHVKEEVMEISWPNYEDQSHHR
jgi:hypothetical protein